MDAEHNVQSSSTEPSCEMASLQQILINSLQDKLGVKNKPN